MKFLFSIIIIFFSYSVIYSQGECATFPRKNYPSPNLNLAPADLNKTDTIPVIFHVLYKNDQENLADNLMVGFPLIGTALPQ